jgi:hypothetical protein
MGGGLGAGMVKEAVGGKAMGKKGPRSQLQLIGTRGVKVLKDSGESPQVGGEVVEMEG